ncbi:hypothetical protein BKA70DRAFT_1283433 [Coprinopsis sp. MPI-PUGE-AT-0042]|nr:hypothetical protein BKA70DRAFT_1283433 [Coprinopsis sp. MPI-PUGE-AT-0042]
MTSFVAALFLALAVTFHIPVVLAAQTVTGRMEYDPPYVRMGPGDKVLFIFQDAIHIKLPVGSDTRLAPSSIGVREEHSFTLYDDYDGEPRYFYSATHCQDGMVFAINPSPGALDAYRAAARNTGNNNAPPPSPSPSPQPQPNPPTTTTVTVGGEVSTIVSQPSPNPQQPPNGDANIASSIPASAGASPNPSSVPSGTTASSSSPSTTGRPSSSLPGAPGEAYEHFIGVGVDGLLTFSPARIQALVGDVVTFEIHSANHSVAQSSFDNPCQPLVKEDGNIGFRSGVLTQTGGEFLKFLRFSIRINDTNPIYAFDGQTEHCQSGMVFAVNVKSEEFTAFQQSAQLGPSKARTEAGGAYALSVSFVSAVIAFSSIAALFVNSSL